MKNWLVKLKVSCVQVFSEVSVERKLFHQRPIFKRVIRFEVKTIINSVALQGATLAFRKPASNALKIAEWQYGKAP